MTELLNGDAKVEQRDGYVRFWHGRPAANLEEWGVLRAAIDALLPEEGGCLVIDSRDSDYTPQDVQAAIWAWLEGSSMKRVAALVQSESLAVSLRMRSIAKGVQLKAFADEGEAEAWLRG